MRHLLAALALSNIAFAGPAMAQGIGVGIGIQIPVGSGPGHNVRKYQPREDFRYHSRQPVPWTGLY